MSARPKPTPLMLRVLELAVAGDNLYRGCSGRSEHGGRSRAINALVKRRYIALNPMRVTDMGHAAIAKARGEHPTNAAGGQKGAKT